MPRGIPNKKRAVADDSHDDMPIRQRVVNAAGAPRPQTSAPASVFAFGQAAKSGRKPALLDPAAVVIRSGVPMPPIGNRTGGTYIALWERMAAGDMVELPDRAAHGLITHVKKLGGKAAIRRLTAGTKGVWRLE